MTRVDHDDRVHYHDLVVTAATFGLAAVSLFVVGHNTAIDALIVEERAGWVRMDVEGMQFLRGQLALAGGVVSLAVADTLRRQAKTVRREIGRDPFEVGGDADAR